jgi:CO/xanthine dehydrogenase Mo-binding subunit
MAVEPAALGYGPRTDAVEKVSGAAVYAGDITRPGMLHARLLRSSVPHARIVRVDAARARQVPGVAAVLTGADLPADREHWRYGPILRDQSIVATDRVRFVGDVVAAVAAASLEAAERALAAIEVEYEELPAVFDPEAALAAGAVVLHPDPNPEEMPGTRPQHGTNVCGLTELVQGDPDTGFAEADEVIEEVYRTPPSQHCFLEPHATIAAWQGGRLTVWTCSQTPFLTRRQLARLYRLSASHVRVVVPYIGGGYGGKTNLRLEPVTSYLAKLTGRPVKLVLTHSEVFHTVTKHGSTVRIRSGITRDARIVAREIDVTLDTGAYADTGPQVAKKCTYTAAPYRIPNVRLRSRCVYTNNPPAGSLRGFGLQQVAWAFESHMDTLAGRLGVDPLEFRRRHLYEEGDRYVTGEPLHSVGLRECLEAVAKKVGYGTPLEQTPGRRRGRGVSIAMKGSFVPSTAGAWVKVNEDGSVMVAAPTPEMGQGSRTVMRQIAAAVLTVPLERVHMAPVDTDGLPFDDGAISSRSTFSVGRAVQDAAENVRQQLLDMAARHLEASAADLVLEAGAIRVKGAPPAMEIPDLMRAQMGRSGTVHGEARVRTFGGRVEENGEAYEVSACFWFIAAGAAEVEVDEETGKVTIRKYATASDVGHALNRSTCESQIRGAAVIGLGQTLSEALRIEDGQIVNASFSDYRIPAFGDLPRQLDVVIVEVPHRDGPFGAKGVGEVAVAPAAAAVGNAIRAATGVRITAPPFHPEVVLRALRESSK